MAAGCVVVSAIILLLGLSAGAAVLHPRVDSPPRVDAIIVLAGVADTRYEFAEQLADQGVAESVLVSRPPAVVGHFGALLDGFCSSDSTTDSLLRNYKVECFSPDFNTTEGETVAATRIARERGWDSLLIVTYWGHVTRARVYFEQCFDGDVHATDTPTRTRVPKRFALLHETGGLVKAFVKPAC